MSAPTGSGSPRGSAPALPSLGQALAALPIDAVRGTVFAVCLLPLARLLWLGTTGGLGANPIEFITRSTGTWTLVMLCLTLAITPLRRLTGWNAAIRLRRMLGLHAFFYGCLHLTTWVWFDQWFDVGDMLRDLARRPFIAIGMAAFLLMLPLAVTSTKGMVRRLGRRWQPLHRLVYGVAVAAVLHYGWHKSGKNDLVEPAIYAFVVAGLLGARLVWWRDAAARAAQGAAGR